jgi:phosphoribosylglycinamide formyltransferase-1
MVEKYPNHIINIHPSLLPKYGGRGMYGDAVHKAVLKNKEIESGISIHFVNQNYDEGELILQEKCSVSANETLETLAAKIHQLERKHLPLTIEKILKNHNL